MLRKTLRGLGIDKTEGVWKTRKLECGKVQSVKKKARKKPTSELRVFKKLDTRDRSQENRKKLALISADEKAREKKVNTLKGKRRNDHPCELIQRYRTEKQ